MGLLVVLQSASLAFVCQKPKQADWFSKAAAMMIQTLPAFWTPKLNSELVTLTAGAGKVG